jgi:hypothetical protein|tara:strand:- start:105 stop:728 length:624 start_codon:yes stop_codon:yes gene_type:complete
MKAKEVTITILDLWLQKADENYISGRFLWMNILIIGSCNLLWLACEQLIKLLLLQKEIDFDISDSIHSDELYKQVNKKGKAIGHDVSKLIVQVNAVYPELNISKYEPTLIKLQEYFYKRYLTNKGSSITLNTLDDIDALYFLLRDQIEPRIIFGDIDQIYIKRKHNWKQNLPVHEYAYLENKSFRPRKHNEIRQVGADGLVYIENGG